MSGWMIDTVPSNERASLQASSSWAAGMCQWLYAAAGGNLEILTDVTGHPLVGSLSALLRGGRPILGLMRAFADAGNSAAAAPGR